MFLLMISPVGRCGSTVAAFINEKAPLFEKTIIRQEYKKVPQYRVDKDLGIYYILDR